MPADHVNGNPTTPWNTSRGFNSNNQVTSALGSTAFAYDGNGNPTEFLCKAPTQPMYQAPTRIPLMKMVYRAEKVPDWEVITEYSSKGISIMLK